MRMLSFLFCLIFSCSQERHEPVVTPAPSDQLAAKAKLYCELSEAKYRATGYVGDECDSLLWTSLRGTYCDGVSVAEFESKVEPGRWYRSPAHDCFVPDQITNKSDSDISKDMMLGLMIYLWHKKDLDAVNRTIEYGKANSWVMGDAKDDITRASKTLLSPGLVSLLYDIQSDLSGKLLDTRSDADSFGVNTGFRAHLDILYILLSTGVHGSIPDPQLKTLKAQVDRQPDNGLFQAAYGMFTGEQGPAQAILMSQGHFPSEALPNNHENHCEPYLWQRDKDDKDWAPCKDESFREHDGTDLIFAAAVSNGLFQKKVQP